MPYYEFRIVAGPKGKKHWQEQAGSFPERDAQGYNHVFHELINQRRDEGLRGFFVLADTRPLAQKYMSQLKTPPEQIPTFFAATAPRY